MKVTIEKSKIITLLYEQEKTDEDYGSCLWARFYLDLNNYTMSIESDCGNYTYGWPPTPKTEPFLHLLARMGTDYLLSKISSETVINGDLTADGILDFIKECAEDECIDLDEEDLESIRDACYHHDNVRDLVDNVKDEVISTELRESLEYNTDYLYGCIVMDYPANATKIAEVFGNCIKPKIKELLKEIPFLAGAMNRPIGCLEGQPAVKAVPIEQYNDLRDAFIDFVCSGIPNPAPYCGKRCPECVDGRGWCKEDPGTCKGFNPTGERNGNGC